MMWSDLPPAGNPIVQRGGASEMPQFPGYKALWVSSGTAALALAIIAARARCPEIAEPEVVMPGYACPDLVAAAEFAGARAVLADIGATDPSYDLASLQSVLNARTIAVVAVNFLGVKERLSLVRELLVGSPRVALIEDNAQWFPEPADALQGDFVCLSFGRGKPIGLLGGGALLIRDVLAETLHLPSSIQAAVEPGIEYGAKIIAYNLLLKPYWYGLISNNPLIKLGQTVFKPLIAIRALDAARRQLLAANAAAYLQHSHATENRLRAQIANNSTLLDFTATVPERSGRLLRYPLLCCDKVQRNELLARLRSAGLGATSMYQKVLPDIVGVTEKVKVHSALGGARAFADRLLTLPVHSGVDERHLQKIAGILR